MQGSRKVSPGTMLLLTCSALCFSKTICFPPRGLKATFSPGEGGLWGGTHTSGSLSIASDSLWMRSRVCFRTGCSFNTNLCQPQLCAGARAARGKGEVFFLGKRQAQIDISCHCFWQAREVLGGLEVRGARSLPGSLIIFFCQSNCFNPSLPWGRGEASCPLAVLRAGWEFCCHLQSPFQSKVWGARIS